MKKQDNKQAELKALLQARIVGLFERDPRAAVVDGLLDALVEDILKLTK